MTHEQEKELRERIAAAEETARTATLELYTLQAGDLWDSDRYSAVALLHQAGYDTQVLTDFCRERGMTPAEALDIIRDVTRADFYR